jgi:hypothetical protein
LDQVVGAVIASEAKQSSFCAATNKAGLLRRYRASQRRMELVATASLTHRNKIRRHCELHYSP